MEQSKAGSRIVFYPVPRFRQRNGTAKIQTVKGLRGEDFGLWECGQKLGQVHATSLVLRLFVFEVAVGFAPFLVAIFSAVVFDIVISPFKFGVGLGRDIKNNR